MLGVRLYPLGTGFEQDKFVHTTKLGQKQEFGNMIGLVYSEKVSLNHRWHKQLACCDSYH